MASGIPSVSPSCQDESTSFLWVGGGEWNIFYWLRSFTKYPPGQVIHCMRTLIILCSCFWYYCCVGFCKFNPRLQCCVYIISGRFVSVSRRGRTKLSHDSYKVLPCFVWFRSSLMEPFPRSLKAFLSWMLSIVGLMCECVVELYLQLSATVCTNPILKNILYRDVEFT